MKLLLELIGDFLLVGFGIVLIFIFVLIEILGYYAMEQNATIRAIELYMGFPIILFGIYHIVKDIKER